MKIGFESRREIRQLATILQNNIYPAPIIIEPSDLLDVCSGDGNRPLPWDTDGFHIPITIKDEKTDGNEQHLYTHEEVFGRGVIWEEVKKDGKVYLRKAISGNTPFTKEEEIIYLAGQLDGYFQLVRAGGHTMRDVAQSIWLLTYTSTTTTAPICAAATSMRFCWKLQSYFRQR